MTLGLFRQKIAHFNVFINTLIVTTISINIESEFLDLLLVMCSSRNRLQVLEECLTIKTGKNLYLVTEFA